MKLRLGGLLPTMTIADWPIAELHSAIDSFVDANQPFLHPLDAIKSKLMSCSSIAEIQRLCDKRSV